jgi:asparagine synthase (glutamine-hydrolysing)
MRWDLQHYLPGLLHAEDRISMAASIESRAPLLDYRLVDLATSLPERSHFRRSTSKPVLRDAVAPWLPKAVADRRDKMGFPTPLERWHKLPRMRGLVQQLVHPSARRNGDSDKSVFTSEFLSRPEALSPGQLWTALSVQAWLTSLDEQVEAL